MKGVNGCSSKNLAYADILHGKQVSLSSESSFLAWNLNIPVTKISPKEVVNGVQDRIKFIFLIQFVYHPESQKGEGGCMVIGGEFTLVTVSK